MSLQPPTSPPPPSETPVSNSPDPVLLTSSKLVDKSDYVDSNEIQHAGYGADFLDNFIDDTPRSSISALDSVIGSQNDHKLQSDFLPSSGALPEAAGLVHHTTISRSSQSPAYSANDMQRPITLSSSFSSLAQQIDSREVCIGKLRNACNALNVLTMPPVLPQRHIPTPTTWSKEKPKINVFNDEYVDLSDDIDADDSVDALLAAAAGCDQDETKQAADLDEAYAGRQDEDVVLLINKAIEILRHHIIYVRGLAANQKGSSGRGKLSRKAEWSTDAEQLALSALEPLLYGGATNTGCLITSERANLLWQLYSHLTHLVTAPFVALSKIKKQAKNDTNAHYHTEESLKKPSLQSGKGKAAKVPVPHQFLSRQKHPS